MKRLHYLILCFCLFLFCQYNSKKGKESNYSDSCINIDFGNPCKDHFKIENNET